MARTMHTDGGHDEARLTMISIQGNVSGRQEKLTVTASTIAAMLVQVWVRVSLLPEKKGRGLLQLLVDVIGTHMR